MAAVGLADALNGMLVVYSSPLSRVSGPLQSVLGQAYLPATLIMSKIILNKAIGPWQVRHGL